MSPEAEIIMLKARLLEEVAEALEEHGPEILDEMFEQDPIAYGKMLELLGIKNARVTQ